MMRPESPVLSPKDAGSTTAYAAARTTIRRVHDDYPFTLGENVLAHAGRCFTALRMPVVSVGRGPRPSKPGGYQSMLMCCS